MRVCMGGTFDKLHRGHEALLSKAFEFGTHVFIGVASDALARKGRKRRIAGYAVRERNLRLLLKKKGWAERATVAKIDHPYGRALEGDYDAIVVSPETHMTAVALNRDRAAAARRPLVILDVPHALAADGLPISSTRLAAREVDAEGRLLLARIAVGSANPVKVRAVKNVARRVFRKATVSAHPVTSGVGAQPFEREAVQGAVNRAKQALAAAPRAHLGIGIEAAILWDAHAQQHHDVQHCAVVDRAGRVTMGHGPGFAYPSAVLERIKQGETVEEAMEALTGIRQIGSGQGAVGFLSRGVVDRVALTESAVLMALLPRLRPGTYGL